MTVRRLLPLPLALALLGPAAAQGQTTPAPPPTPVPTEPVPVPVPEPVPAPPRPGAAAFTAKGGLATKAVRYYAPFQQIVLRGRARPAVPGEVVRLTVIRRGKAGKQVRRRVRRGGRFTFRFKAGKPGMLRLVVRHPRSSRQAAFRADPMRVRVVRWSAGTGARGVKVRLLQRGLTRLGFATPKTGFFDWLTANAVNAFRKTNRMGRTGHASTSVYAKVLRRRGAFRLRYPKAGKHVEFDWSRQVLVLARKGRPYRVYHVSSGKPSTPTVFGTYRFYLKTPGTNSRGMVHSNYFVGGYAIHGYPSVPNYPASHGCLRVPIPNAASIFRWIDIGDRIFLYR
jgi:hypothetical protein